MKKLLLYVAFFVSAACFALEPGEWQCRQSFTVERAGMTRMVLPLGTLGRLNRDLGDLRLIGPDGGVVPYVILQHPGDSGSLSVKAERAKRPVEVRLDTEKKETVVVIATGTDAPINAVEIRIADTTDYTRAARIEISDDRQTWKSLGGGWPVFRRNVAGEPVTGNYFEIGDCLAAYVRITIPSEDAPLVVTDAFITSLKKDAPRPVLFFETATAAINSVVEKPGETELTLDLGSANLMLFKVDLDIDEPLFIRDCSVEADGITMNDRDRLYRFAIDEKNTASRTTLQLLRKFNRSRYLTVRIQNGDSPPLHVRGAKVAWFSAHLVFNASQAGRYELLSGNPQADAPSYDIAQISKKFTDLPLAKITAGPLVVTPDYRPPAPPAEPGQFTKRAIFWVALALVVGVLLFVVGKLLPKTEK